ncbi:MAG: hypothetical protein CR968_01865 [Flavobacteriia bacterium]|nr:MAG: hypothetical protein CR968_01865 [Flavobacteriia bacterium]
MSLEKILSISGRPGLYKLLSQTKGHIIVESLQDGKRLPVTGVHQVNSLGSIAVYTYTEELALGDVFYKMFKHLDGKEAVSPKSSSKELLAFFEEVLPDYDRERVYASHVKKMIQWYHSLLSSDFDFETLAPQTKEDHES